MDSSERLDRRKVLAAAVVGLAAGAWDETAAAQAFKPAIGTFADPKLKFKTRPLDGFNQALRLAATDFVAKNRLKPKQELKVSVAFQATVVWTPDPGAYNEYVVRLTP